ncbi:MAG: glutamate 5-kinase [Pirellulales bacterium]|nr:glutamate 5-kinase [Pirellulales bacterium]
MLDPVRQEIVTNVDTIVVKVGTRVLTRDDGTLDTERVEAIGHELVRLVDDGRRVALVSSGAVGAGMGRLGLTSRPSDLAQLQSVASVGQSRLIEAYNRALETHGRHAAQILLTADDLNDRTRYLNVRNTILALFRYGAIPIINENDTVRVDELQRNVGDNDQLAAMVTNLIRAPLLVLLSDVAGLYNGPPGDSDSSVIPVVNDLNQAIHQFICDTNESNAWSKGGMRSKLEAAQIATAAGENVIIADGRQPGVLTQILQAEPLGTLFLAQGPAITSKKRWIGFTAQPAGQLQLDAGAVRAIVERRRSLLAIGVLTVIGQFAKGDVVTLADEYGCELARGLINYHAEEMRKIAGHPSDQIVQLLGHCPYEEVVHRDNLVALAR